MSLFNVLSVSASGMAAQRARAEVVVENLANSETTRTAEGGPYRRKDVVFTSEPLAAPLEVTGRVRAHLMASSDCPDTDFIVRLCDVYPDGRSYNVCEGGLRARFRKSLSREALMTPGKAERLGIDLWSTSIVFNRGHRIRLQVTSSSDPGLDPNPNTGEPFRSSPRTRVARNTLLLGGVKASYLALPEMGTAGR